MIFTLISVGFSKNVQKAQKSTWTGEKSDGTGGSFQQKKRTRGDNQETMTSKKTRNERNEVWCKEKPLLNKYDTLLCIKIMFQCKNNYWIWYSPAFGKSSFLHTEIAPLEPTLHLIVWTHSSFYFNVVFFNLYLTWWNHWDEDLFSRVTWSRAQQNEVTV